MPRPSPKSAAAKKRAANAAKAKLSQSPNGSATIKEISEEKHETISPLVEPSPKADGLPLPEWEEGKAVMMTFTHLDDLIAKIKHLTASVHDIPIARLQFDFMPVTFVRRNAPSPHVEINAPSPSTSVHETTTGPSSTKPSLQSGLSPSTQLRSKTSTGTFLRLNKSRRQQTTEKNKITEANS